MFVFFCVLAVRLFNIQIADHEDYGYYAQNQQIKNEYPRAERGLIYDRNGELLAYDRSDVSFYVDVRMIKQKRKKEAGQKNNKETEQEIKQRNKKEAEQEIKQKIDSIATRFSQVFDKSKDYYIDLIKNGAGDVCLEKKAPAELAIKLRDYVAEGLFSKEEPTRIYSYDNLASHLLGYVGNDYKGTEGLEKYYDKELTGKDGRMIIQRDVRGRIITVSEDATIQPVHGKNLVLTIDKIYQNILEEELKNGVEQFQSSSAIGIVMDPNNGDILALANVPDFNPNNYFNFKNEDRKNRAITDTYEPGSTFKSVAISTIIDKNLCRFDEKIYVENGCYRYKNVNITDSHKYQNLTVREIIEKSSNIGMTKLTGRIGRKSFYEYLRNYGFGNYSFIDLPGESKGKLKEPASFNELTQAFMSFGYEVSVTPLQVTAAYAALINGGNLYQPRVVKKITSQSGKVVEEIAPKWLRRVISESTSANVRSLLQGVVENGTGDKAKIADLAVGGKTGTSQQLINNKYSSNSHNSSFVGFFPVDNPKILIYIMMSAPKLGQFGGVVAAPVFKRISERLLKTDIELLSKIKVRNKPVNMNNFGNVFAETGRSEGSTKFANISEVKEKTPKAERKVVNKNIMPDLKIIDFRDAIAVLTEMGIKNKVNGKGKVVSQSILPGTAIHPGLTCVLNCEEKKISGVRIN